MENMQGQEVIFIQVGSNVGVMKNDPLCSLILRDNWKGVLIEPVPKIFEKLKKNYEGRSGLYFENVAISDTRKTCEFYIVEDGERGWVDQLGSLDQNHLLKWEAARSKEEIKVIQVDCVTLQDIVDKYQMPRVDVLHIDAEGHDATILHSIDFEKIKPKFIFFEHMHMTFEKYLSCMGHLRSHGYEVTHTDHLDTIVMAQ